jgi:DNA-binding MarR family transcriptional regulator
VSEKWTIGYVVWRLAMRLRVGVDRALAPIGLTHAQYSLIASLYGLRQGGVQPTQRELADHTGLEPMYVSKLARQLEIAGWVERVRDSRDARSVRLAITPAGSEVTRTAIGIVGDLLDQLTAPLGGRSSARTLALQDSLEALLGAPLDLTGPIQGDPS